VILFLHNRYRVTGGEERAVEDLLWLMRDHLGEDVELLERDSAALGRPRAAVALLRGGLQPDDVGTCTTIASCARWERASTAAGRTACAAGGATRCRGCA
jgi:hypothetical protein